MITAEQILDELNRIQSNSKAVSDTTIKQCEDLLVLAFDLDDKEVQASVHHTLAQLLYNKALLNKAEDHISLAVKIREELNLPAKLSSSLNSSGIIAMASGDYSKSLSDFFKALRIREDLKDNKAIANTLVNIGSVYHWLKNTGAEKDIYQRVLLLAKEMNDDKLEAYTHLNLGVLHAENDEHDLALTYLENVEAVLTNSGDTASALKSVNALAIILQKQGKLSDALYQFNRCYEMLKEIGHESSMIAPLKNMAEVKLQLGMFEEGKENLYEAIRLAKQYGEKEFLKDAHELESEFYKQQEDYKHAFESYQEHARLKEELMNPSKLKQIGELQLNYDLDKKQGEVEAHIIMSKDLNTRLSDLNIEKNKTEEILSNVLPVDVLQELKETGTARARVYNDATVMFIDVKNFSIISKEMPPEKLIIEIDFIFRKFDEIVSAYQIEKIKTIGDAYQCASGILKADENHLENMLLAAIEIGEFIKKLKQDKINNKEPYFEIRTGIHCGALVAGIVGTKKYMYDIWGDTVNNAARLEQYGEVGKINVSETVYNRMKDKFHFEPRGIVETKNNSSMEMFLLTAQIT